MLFDSLEICRGNYNPLRVMTASNPQANDFRQLPERVSHCHLTAFRLKFKIIR